MKLFVTKRHVPSASWIRMAKSTASERASTVFMVGVWRGAAY